MNNKRADLTDSQKKVYGYISEYLRDNKFPPTIREIQRNFGFKSANSAVSHINKLKEKGYITTGVTKKNGMSARTMQVVDNIMGFHLVQTEELSKALALLKNKGHLIDAQSAVELLYALNIKIS